MINRRIAALGLPWFLAGCTGSRFDLGGLDIGAGGIYASVDSEPFPVPAIDLRRINPNFLRREVAYGSDEKRGTVIVDPSARYAYVIENEGRAIRYGVGGGKTEAFNFRGTAVIGRKSKWPDWTPTAAMIAREPARYGPYAGGLPGGLGNPLGPRALYLYSHGGDTHYRLHGTIAPWTIGTMVSSGCIRFINQDIIDLYDRVPVGSKVIVLPAGQRIAAG